MKSFAIIILTVIVLSSCHHTTAPAPVTTLPPSTTTSSTITPYVGTWYLDTVKVVKQLFSSVTLTNYTFIVSYVTSNPIYYWGLTSTVSTTSASMYNTSYFGYVVGINDTAYTTKNTVPGGNYSVNIDGNNKVTEFGWVTQHWGWNVSSGYYYANGTVWGKVINVDAHNLSVVYCITGNNCTTSITNFYYHFHK